MLKNIKLNEKDSKKRFHELIKVFQNTLSEERILEIAEETGANDSRIRNLPIYPFTILMIFGQELSSNLSLKALGNFALDWELTRDYQISPERISQQVEERGFDFFIRLFNELLKIASELPHKARKKVLKRFEKVKILDSTVIRLFSKLVDMYPGTKGQAALKLHVRMDLNNGIPEDTKITEATSHDNNHALFDKEKGEHLYIMDLGYLDFGQLERLKRNNDHFVIRRKKNLNLTVIKDLTEENPNWKDKKLKDIEEDRELDLLVQCESGLIVRLVKIWDYEEQEYFSYLTSLLDTQNWTIEDIRELYKYRWVIEILFRDIKHVLGCTKIIFRTEERIISQIYASLCYYLIIRVFILIAAIQEKKAWYQYSITKCQYIIRNNCAIWYKAYKRDEENCSINDLVQNILLSVKQKGLKAF